LIEPKLAMFTKRRLKWARPLDRPQFESMGMTAAWRPLPAAPVRAAGCHAPYASQFGVLVILIQANAFLVRSGVNGV
jgi:hypothetical protein